MHDVTKAGKQHEPLTLSEGVSSTAIAVSMPAGSGAQGSRERFGPHLGPAKRGIWL
jgi:hypothetical protein